MDNEYSQLFYAASAGDLEQIRSALPAAGPEERNRALAQAAALSHFEAAELLLGNGAEANGLFRDSYGTVLFPACEYVNPDGIAYLLRHGADPRKRVLRLDGKRDALQHLLHSHHRSPLHSTCVRLLLDAGSRLESAAEAAILCGSLSRLQQSLQEDPDALMRPLEVDYGFFPLQGASLLHLAVEFAQPDLARFLIGAGLPVNHLADRIPGTVRTQPVYPTDCISLGGHSALFHAKGLSKGLLRLLLDHGANPDLRAPFIRQGKEVELSPLEFFEATDAVECNLLEEILLLKGY